MFSLTCCICNVSENNSFLFQKKRISGEKVQQKNFRILSKNVNNMKQNQEAEDSIHSKYKHIKNKYWNNPNILLKSCCKLIFSEPNLSLKSKRNLCK